MADLSKVNPKTVRRWYWRGKGYSSHTSACKAIAKKEVAIYCATIVKPWENQYQRSERSATTETLTTVKEAYAWLFESVLGGDQFHWQDRDSDYSKFISKRTRQLLDGAPTCLREDVNYHGNDEYEYEQKCLEIYDHMLEEVFPWHEQFAATVGRPPHELSRINITHEIKPAPPIDYDPFGGD